MNERDLDKALEEGVYSKRTLRKAIKLKCLDCCGGSWNEVKLCKGDTTCFLHPFRLGANPWGRKQTEEQKQLAKERLQKWREENGK